MTCIDRFEKTIFSIKYHISRVKVLSFFFEVVLLCLIPSCFVRDRKLHFHSPLPYLFTRSWLLPVENKFAFFTFLYSALYLKLLKKKKRISNRFKNKVDISFCVIEAGLALQLISNFFVLNQSLFLGLINLRQEVLWPVNKHEISRDQAI